MNLTIEEFIFAFSPEVDAEDSYDDDLYMHSWDKNYLRQIMKTLMVLNQ